MSRADPLKFGYQELESGRDAKNNAHAALNASTSLPALKKRIVKKELLVVCF